MNLVVTTEQRFDRTPDGVVWTPAQSAYTFFLRYLEVFDTVRVVARVRDVAAVPAQYVPSSGAGVTFTTLPHFRGPLGFLCVARQARRIAQAAVGRKDAVLLRIPSLIATLIESGLKHAQHPFGVEVIGDPYDVFAPNVINHPLRFFFRRWFAHRQKRQCRNSCASAYVTEKTLQRRYPSKSNHLGISDVEIDETASFSRNQVVVAHYSSVELGAADFSTLSRRDVPEARRFRLITVGSLEMMYKAPDVLIRAVSKCVEAGLDLEVVIVGDGRFRPPLESLARKLGVDDRVHFRGMLPFGKAVRTELDAADVFVLASRTEGLPRAMIEAMARGLPCIGSTAGGIPELLNMDDLVPPGNIIALAEKIQSVVTSTERMRAMSVRNLKKSAEFSNDILARRRRVFYEYLRAKTESWINESPAQP